MKEYARLIFSLLIILILKKYEVWSMLIDAAQTSCLSFYRHLTYASYHQALVCGSPLPNDSFLSQLLQVGLIHMLVVSGAHLGFLQSFFRLLRIPDALTWVFLCLYTLFTGAQPPVLRALVQRWFDFPTRMHQVFWAGIFCLGVFGFSYSLLLSWLATLGVLWPGGRERGLYKQALLIYSVMIPALFSLGTQHPLSVVWNVLVAALLGWGLLPASMIAPLHPWLALFSEWLWHLFLALTQWMAWITPAWDFRFGLHAFWPWLYLFCLQWFAFHKEQSYYREKL